MCVCVISCVCHQETAYQIHTLLRNKRIHLHMCNQRLLQSLTCDYSVQAMFVFEGQNVGKLSEHVH